MDAARTWFRYHRLFADLLRLELRRTEPAEVAGLHAAGRGLVRLPRVPVEAIRHAQAAQDWDLAARLLADHWPGLHLDGQAATVHALLAGFPAGAPAADAGLAAVTAADELAQGSLEAAERYLRVAERGSAPEQTQLLLGVVRLLLAWYQGDLAAVPSRRGGCRWPARPRTRPTRGWARSCARWRWPASPTPRSGRVGSIRQSCIWSTR